MELLARDATVYVAGHRGLAGAAITRRLHAAGWTNVVGQPSAALDLRDRESTRDYLRTVRPDVVVVAAARVGGIVANQAAPVDFLSDNLRIQLNVLDAAAELRVPRLLFLGSSCIYPKHAPQPIREDALLTGPLEPTNEAYAIAKIAGILQVQAVRRQYGLSWISAMPTNLYGPGDNFADTTSHLLPALIRRYETARVEGADEVVNFGTGTPRRELLHVDDLADACVHLLRHHDAPAPVNIGTGVDHTIAEIADMVARSVGYPGRVAWDQSRPDGTHRKLLDVSVLAELGWRSRIAVEDGIASTVEWFRAHRHSVRI